MVGWIIRASGNACTCFEELKTSSNINWWSWECSQNPIGFLLLSGGDLTQFWGKKVQIGEQVCYITITEVWLPRTLCNLHRDPMCSRYQPVVLPHLL
jgi:hypothetical protein